MKQKLSLTLIACLFITFNAQIFAAAKSKATSQGSTKTVSKSSTKTSAQQPPTLQKSQKEKQYEINSNLTKAVTEGNMIKIREALAAGAEINNNPSLLYEALHINNPEVVDLLINAGATDPDHYPYHSSLLTAAIRKGNPQIVERLLQAGYDPEASNYPNSIPLYEAIVSGNPLIVKALLNANVNVDWGKKDGSPLNSLSHAIYCDSPTILKMLLNHGANMSLTEFVSYPNPLASKYHVEGESGFKVKSIPAFHQAAEEGNIDMLKEFLSHGVDIEMKDKFTRTALHYAVLSKNEHTVKLLLDKNANVNARDNKGITPLLLAAETNPVVTEMLLKAGANINETDALGNAALHHAAQAGQTDIIKFLLNNNVPINAKNKNGNTALHLAARGNDALTVQTLLAKGADVSIKNNENKTALDYANELEDENLGLIEILETAQKEQMKKDEELQN